MQWNLGQGVPSQSSRGHPPRLDCRRESSGKSLGDVLPENVMLRRFVPHQPLRQELSNTWQWDVGAGVGMRIERRGGNGEEISPPSQVQTFPLQREIISRPRIDLFNN